METPRSGIPSPSINRAVQKPTGRASVPPGMDEDTVFPDSETHFHSSDKVISPAVQTSTQGDGVQQDDVTRLERGIASVHISNAAEHISQQPVIPEVPAARSDDKPNDSNTTYTYRRRRPRQEFRDIDIKRPSRPQYARHGLPTRDQSPSSSSSSGDAAGREAKRTRTNSVQPSSPDLWSGAQSPDITKQEKLKIARYVHHINNSQRNKPRPAGEPNYSSSPSIRLLSNRRHGTSTRAQGPFTRFSETTSSHGIITRTSPSQHPIPSRHLSNIFAVIPAPPPPEQGPQPHNAYKFDIPVYTPEEITVATSFLMRKPWICPSARPAASAETAALDIYKLKYASLPWDMDSRRQINKRKWEIRNLADVTALEMWGVVNGEGSEGGDVGLGIKVLGEYQSARSARFWRVLGWVWGVRDMLGMSGEGGVEEEEGFEIADGE